MDATARNQRTKRVKCNLSADEEGAIEEFLEQKDYIARPEDKGSNFAILSVTQYREKTMETLRKSGFVEVPDFNIDVLADRVTKKLVDWYFAGELSTEVFEALLPKYPYAYMYRPANQYGLIKTHKSDPSNERIVTSSTGTVTQKISRFVLYHLMEAWKNLPYLIKDSKGLIQTILRLRAEPRIHRDAQNQRLQIFSADVTSLYPSVQHSFGSALTRYCLNKFGDPDRAPHPALSTSWK